MRTLLFIFVFFIFSAQAQVQIWGVAPYGGTNGTGTIFFTDSSGGNFTKAYDFQTTYPGQVTWSAPVLASDGNLYGVVNYGGVYNYGGIYKYNASSSAYSLAYNFHDSENIQSGSINCQLIEYNNSGILYGMSMNGGANGTGFIFKFDINTSLMTRVADFDAGVTISYANSNSLMGCSLNFYPPNGKYYGACAKGGKNGNGFIFEFDPVLKTIIRKLEFNNYPSSFNGTTDPYLTFNSNNNYFIGTSTYGGATGVVYEFDPIADTAYVRANLTATTQLNSVSGPMKLFTDGNYYMTAKISSGVNNGGICAYNPITHAVALKFAFSSSSFGNGGGNNLVDGGNGKYYGTCTNGGTSLYGCLFEYNPSTNSCLIKHTFPSSQSNPYDSPILLPSGKMLGVVTGSTTGINNSKRGAMYTFDPATATYTSLFTFESAPNGKNPKGSMIQGANGKLYGTTYAGGTNNMGVIFEIDPVTKVYTKKYDFTSANGDSPISQLVLGNDNKIYGVTNGDPYAFNTGVLFQYDPATNTYAKKYSFPSGSYPNSLICLAKGNLIYGNAGSLGSSGNLYEYNITTNTYTIKHASVPSSGWSVGLDNNVYGAALTGSTAISILKYDISAGVYSTPRQFSSNFYQLSSKLLTLYNGNLIGSAGYGNNLDVIYKYNPYTNSSPSVVYSLPSNNNNYFFYYSSFVQSNSMNVYGLYNNNGVISLFEYNVSSNAFTTKHSLVPMEGIVLPQQGSIYNDLPLTLINTNNPIITSQPPTSVQICPGQSFTLNTAASGTNLKYQWYKNGSPITGDTLDSLSISSVVLADAGYYNCLVTGNSGFTSSNVTNVVINSYPTPTVTATQNPICQGNTTKLTASGASTYTWSANAGGVTTTTVNVSPSSNTVYTVTGANGTCQSISTYSVSVTSLPVITVSASGNPICSSQSTTLSASGATSYTWLPINSTSNPITIMLTNTATYTVNGIANGCSGSAVITITVNPIPVLNSISNQSVCAGSSVNAVNFSSTPSGASTQWTNTDTLIGISANGLGNIAGYTAPVVTVPHSGVITVAPTLNGCTGPAKTFTITVNSLPNVIANATQTAICNGDSVTLTGSGASSYSWSGGVSDGIGFSPASSQTYTVTGTDNLGCTSSNTVAVAIEYCVWPGDADENLVVDNSDLLPIGIKFGQSGSARNNQDNFWQSHLASDWADTLSNGKNIKYSDCNGDGLINMNDTLAINLNYGNTHTARIYPNSSQSSNADIFLLFNKTFYYPGDTVYAFVHIGNNSSPQSNFYGSAFTLYYDNTKVQAGTEQFYFNNSWVGNINQSKIKFSKIFSSSGKIDASLVRTTHADTSGYGQVATLKFILSNSVGYGQLYFTISGAVKADHDGNLASLNTGTDSVATMPQTTGINKFNFGQIVLYPNPSHSLITLQAQTDLGGIKIYNSLGEIIFNELEKTNKTTINISDLPAGVYTVKLKDRFIRFVKE